MDKSLVVLAAGMGSRYGGLKQMDPVGPHGEFILDYGVGAALAAGFGRIVFVIRKDIEKDFREIVGGRWEKRADVVESEIESLRTQKAVETFPDRLLRK